MCSEFQNFEGIINFTNQRCIWWKVYNGQSLILKFLNFIKKFCFGLSLSLTSIYQMGDKDNNILFLEEVQEYNVLSQIADQLLHSVQCSVTERNSMAPKQVNIYVKRDLKLNVHWLRANRIPLNVNKTETVIFWSKRNEIPNINFRISRQKMIPKTKTKYLGLVLDEHLIWSAHTNILKNNLSRSNGLLSKLRNSTSQNRLITIYIWLSYMGPIKKSNNK